MKDDHPGRLKRQLSLDLLPRTHGGARPGAGRPRKKDDERAFVAHQARPRHRKGEPVHVTVRVVKGLPPLRCQLLENRVRRALLRQRWALAARNATHFQVVHFSIQNDHIHLLVEAPDKRGLWRGMTGLEVRITRAINDVLGRKGRLWTERYHRRDLGSPSQTRNALRYVLLNFQKHHRIVVAGGFADPCSSAPTFDGFAREPVVFDEELPWARVAPRTWLLGVGWRRHGLVDPADVPSVATNTPKFWQNADRTVFDG